MSTPNFWRLQYLDIFNKVKLIPSDLLDGYSIVEALKISKPHEIYNLAAQSFVGASFEQPISSAEISGLGVTRAIRVCEKISLQIVRYIKPQLVNYMVITFIKFKMKILNLNHQALTPLQNYMGTG